MKVGDDNLRRLQEFLADKPPAATDAEFADDLADYAARLRDSARGGGRRERPKGEGIELPLFELPPSIADRQRRWVSERLKGLERHIEVARWFLGFDDVPFAGRSDVADALGSWAFEYVDARRRKLIAPDPDPSCLMRLGRA